MSIGSNIKRRRFELNMSQGELAKLMGYKTRSTIAKIESGENDITIDKLQKIAQHLETTLEDLIIGSDVDSQKVTKKQERPARTHNIAVILAGGRPVRTNQNIPTQFVSVLGKPLIMYALETYQKHPFIDEIIVVCLKGWEDILRSYVDRYKITKVSAILQDGPSAIESVRNALNYLWVNPNIKDDDLLIFQEATRPLVPEELISKLLYSAREQNTAVTYESMQEYIQFYRSEEKTECLDRDKIITIQGPEAYTFGTIKNAFIKSDKIGHQMTESCCYMLLHNLGEELYFCEGSRNNIKIVRQEDIILMEALLRK